MTVGPGTLRGASRLGRTLKVYDNEKPGETILISTSPGPAFNEALKAAKVPLSPGAE